jgi:nucleoside-diphosphate-sugar epimerase
VSVLVLGSSGLVGRRLVARLATEGRTVVACDVVGPTAAPIAGVSYVQAGSGGSPSSARSASTDPRQCTAIGR